MASLPGSGRPRKVTPKARCRQHNKVKEGNHPVSVVSAAGHSWRLKGLISHFYTLKCLQADIPLLYMLLNSVLENIIRETQIFNVKVFIQCFNQIQSLGPFVLERRRPPIIH